MVVMAKDHMAYSHVQRWGHIGGGNVVTGKVVQVRAGGGRGEGREDSHSDRWLFQFEAVRRRAGWELVRNSCDETGFHDTNHHDTPARTRRLLVQYEG